LKVLLIWPRAQYEADWGSDLGAIAEPLALEYLAAGLKQNHHDVRVLDLRLHPNDLISTLREYQPDMVGVTAFSMHVKAALDVCKTVKAISSSCWTIAGGHHATFHPEDFFVDALDFVVSGEGVKPLNTVVQRLQDKQCVTDIAGLWHRVNGTFELGAAQEKFDVDDLPAPDREITGEDRQKYFIDWMRPIALLRTSVGCPFRCTFCSLWQLTDGKYLIRDIERVVNEIATIKEDFIFLVDDEAFINGKRMKALAEALNEAGLKKRYFSYCRIDSLIRQKEALQAWKEIGLERLFVGIDAISGKDLSEYNKRINLSQIEEGLKVAKEVGIEIFAQFVVNTDYTRQDFAKLKRFISHHDIDYPTFTVLTPLPGTELLKDFSCVVELQENGRPDWDLFDTAHVVTETRLPREIFNQEYRGLFKEYRSIYQEYRDRAVNGG